MSRAAVFVDRDGVLVRDVDLLVRAEQIDILPGVAAALRRLHQAGFPIIVVTNQPVVARGMLTEAEVEAIEDELHQRLRAAGGHVDAFYYCPHHPHADVAAYRVSCQCRKPRPGLLERAAREHDLDLSASVMIGDRPTDLAAGRRAGCRRTVQVETGMHLAEPIVSADGPLGDLALPDHRCADLAAAAQWLLAPGGGQ
jgi:D-glycero-D-manno-heptose 1,7-bisphosphate phosphatase